MSDEDYVKLVIPPAPEKEPETASVFAWRFLERFVLFLFIAALVGYVTMLAWNGLTDVTTLPEITFKEGVCVWILLRILAVNFKS